MNSKTTVHGAVSIVNALATGKGSALGISLETTAEVMLTNDENIEIIINNDKSEDKTLALECFKLIKPNSSESIGAKITINSDIPIGRGLKSSSAAASAIVLSCLKAFDLSFNEKQVLDLSVQASKNAGVTITGALDDTSACLLGGLVVTDNLSNKILSRKNIDDDYSILIHVPKHKSYTKDVDLSNSNDFHSSINTLISMTMEGNYLNAMSLNGMIYSKLLNQSDNASVLALKSNALASGLSGTGPSVAAICNSDTKSSIIDSWKNLDGDIISAQINNETGL
tara:strand:- start:3512 stop:4360 length:849 start_codon:yes stop_codon:yes gene_type:complete